MQKTSALASYANFIKRSAEGEYENKPDDREYVTQEMLRHPAVRGMNTGGSVGEGIGSGVGALAGLIYTMKKNPKIWNVTKSPGLNDLISGIAIPAAGGLTGGILGSHIGSGIGALTGAGKKTREEWHGKMKDYRENPDKYYFEPKEASDMQKTAALEAYVNFMKRAADEEGEVDPLHPALRGMKRGIITGGAIGTGLGGLAGALAGRSGGDALQGALSGGLRGAAIGGGLGALTRKSKRDKWHAAMKAQGK